MNDVTPQKKNALHIAAEHDQAVIASILLQNDVVFEALDAQWNNGKFLLDLTVRLMHNATLTAFTSSWNLFRNWCMDC